MQVEKKEIIDQVIEEVKAEIKEPVVTEVAKTFEQEKADLEKKQKEIEAKETAAFSKWYNEGCQKFNRRVIANYSHTDGGAPGFTYGIAFLNKK